MKRMTIAAFAGLMSLSAASAADVYDKRNDALADPYPVAQAETNWTGLWVGAVGGYQFSNSELNLDYDDDGAVGLAETLSAGVNGLGAQDFFGEVQTGFDYQISNRLLVGVLAGYGVSDAEFSAGYASTFEGNPTGSGSLEASEAWHGILGVRLGLVKSPDTMFYGAGGWAFGELDSISLTDSAGETSQFKPEDTDLSGWFAEIGAEHRIIGNVFGTISGRYTNFGSNTIVSGNECAHGSQQDNCSYALTADRDDLAVMVGVKAKLGGF